MKNIYYILAVFLTTPYAFKGCRSKSDRLDSIVKDLPANSYSLSLDQAYPEQGITRASYGAGNFIVYAEPEDVKCGTDWTLRLPRHPVIVWGSTKRVVPITCPEYVPRNIAEMVRNMLAKADNNKYGGLREIRTFNANKVLLADDRFTSQFASLKPDMMDDSVLKGLDYSKFLLLDEPANLVGAKRNFYGAAKVGFDGDVASAQDGGIVLKNDQVVLKFWRKYIGCFDPILMKEIRHRLARFNPNKFNGSQVDVVGNGVAVFTRQ